MSRVYFTDRDLGKQFGAILRSGGLTVERHADRFAHDTPDEVWLAAVGRTEGAIRGLIRATCLPPALERRLTRPSTDGARCGAHG